jgi:hypothetical protein
MQLNCYDNDDSDDDDKYFDDTDFDYDSDENDDDYDDDDDDDDNNNNDNNNNDDDAIPCRNACGLAIGYSKSIVVDLGFVLQGNEEHELPEVLMGCYSCYRVDMSTGTRLI